ncbi:CGNR zinc finger domain-containing protein, partial [Nocardia sp. JMUB6875]|uniref:CGNR zinc finger domain-containing protein n=1 Tax=Nocardia sp. JMUB6875 TaxID=3158170 RepID=UPI0034E8CCC5
GPASTPEVADPARLPGWLAADNLLHLLASTPDRIRQCAHPDCVLFFLDTSKNGTRRWHSMTTCGNRAKATRHYAKKTQGD